MSTARTTDDTVAACLKNVVGRAALSCLLLSCCASAATQSVIVNAAFDVPLSLVRNSDINFGTLKAATSGIYVIDTNGTITPSHGGAVVGGAPTPGQITITGSATQTVTIGTGSYMANGGVTPSAATCSYDGAVIVNCDAGGAGLAAPGGVGKVLRLGVKITADGTQAVGATVTPAFVLSVIYN